MEMKKKHEKSMGEQKLLIRDFFIWLIYSEIHCFTYIFLVSPFVFVLMFLFNAFKLLICTYF